MKKAIKFFTVFVLMMSLVCVLMIGCSKDNPTDKPAGKPTVNLNDYVTVTGDGYDGYGTIHASVDYEKIVEDYSDRLADNLDAQYFGDKTPKVAAMFVFESYNPYVLAYEAPENAKNGDKVAFGWNTSESGIETLAKVLDVNFTCEGFEHEIKELKPLTEVDPFENVDIPHGGFSGIKGFPNGSYVSTDYMKTSFSVGEHSITLELITDEDTTGRTWKNGDTLHVKIDPNTVNNEELARKYGVLLSRTEADITFDNFAYYPIEEAQDVFELLGEDSKANALTAITELMASKDQMRRERLSWLVCCSSIGMRAMR